MEFMFDWCHCEEVKNFYPLGAETEFGEISCTEVVRNDSITDILRIQT